MNRTIRQPVGDSADIARLPAKATRASKFLAFDANGEPIASALISTASATPEGVGFDSVVDVDAYTDFAAAVAAQGSLVKTLLIGSSKVVAGNVTVPSTLTLWFVGQGQLSINSGVTVTINGPLIAPPRQVFSGSGTVKINNQDEILANWFVTGGTGTNADPWTGWTSFVNAIPTSSTGPTITIGAGGVNFSNGVFGFSSTVQLDNQKTTLRAGRDTYFKWTGGASPMFRFNADRITFDGGTLDGGGTATRGIYVAGVVPGNINANWPTIKNMLIRNVTEADIVLGNDSGDAGNWNVTQAYLENLELRDGTHGIIFQTKFSSFHTLNAVTVTGHTNGLTFQNIAPGPVQMTGVIFSGNTKDINIGLSAGGTASLYGLGVWGGEDSTEFFNMTSVGRLNAVLIGLTDNINVANDTFDISAEGRLVLVGGSFQGLVRTSNPVAGAGRLLIVDLGVYWGSNIGPQLANVDAKTSLFSVNSKLGLGGASDPQDAWVALVSALQINAGNSRGLRLWPGNSTSGLPSFLLSRTAPTYGASVAIDTSLGNEFDVTATDGVAFTVANPTNATDGQRITITIRNTSGGALGVLTFDTLYKASAWTQPANGFSRSIDFKYNGTNWVQIGQTGVDVPN
jgi:hypothetical protein